MSLLNKLIVLADKLDSLSLNKYADNLDKIVVRAARGEDFADLTKLFDAPLDLKDTEEGVPVRNRLTNVPEDYEVLAPLEDPYDTSSEPSHDRMTDIKRRHELLKLKKMLEHESEPEEHAEKKELADTEDGDEIAKALQGEFPEDAFEDEDAFDANMNNADDGLIDELKEKLKGAPELAMKVLMLIKDNPELLELLAL